MDMNIVICDDEEAIANNIVKYLDHLTDSLGVIRVFDNLYDFQSYLDDIEHKVIDILIMDIKMNSDNGIEFVKKNREYLKGTMLIYITGYDEYIEDTFETDPIYVLRKPIDEEKLEKAYKKAYQKLLSINKTITVMVQKELIKIKLADIYYIESNAREIAIHLKGEVITTYEKLSSIEQKLSKNFLRIHKSFIVNIDKIEKYRTNQVVLIGGKVIPISRTYRDVAKHKILNFLEESSE